MDYERTKLRNYEEFVFNNILKNISFYDLLTNSSLLDDVAICDSLGVRAYTEYNRSFETDIDFLISGYNSRDDLCLFLVNEFNPDKYDKKIYANKAFLRLYYSVPYEQEFGNEFIIDFHVGGYFHKNALLVEAYKGFYEGTRWMDVNSIGGLETINLPIPSPEELFIFKLLKYLGRDDVDLISLLLSGSVDLRKAENKIKKYRNIKKRMIANFDALSHSFDKVVSRWKVYYQTTESEDNIETVKKELNEMRSRAFAR